MKLEKFIDKFNEIEKLCCSWYGKYIFTGTTSFVGIKPYPDYCLIKYFMNDQIHSVTVPWEKLEKLEY